MTCKPTEHLKRTETSELMDLVSKRHRETIDSTRLAEQRVRDVLNLLARRESADMAEPHRSRARDMAAKYVWWKDPDEALRDQAHFLSMMMTYATLADTQWMLEHFPKDALIEALRHAPPGIFNGRSWHFWHLRLGIHPVGELPRRRLPQ